MKSERSRIGLTIITALAGIFLILANYSDNKVIINIRGEILEYVVLCSSLILLLLTIRFIWIRIQKMESGSDQFLPNLACFIAFITVMVIGILYGFDNTQFQKNIYTIQLSAESALTALVCLGLLCATIRFSHAPKSTLKTSFVISAAFFLILYCGFADKIPGGDPIKQIIQYVKMIPTGGIYGLLLGLAIGALITGIRILFLGEHPYGERK